MAEFKPLLSDAAAAGAGLAAWAAKRTDQLASMANSVVAQSNSDGGLTEDELRGGRVFDFHRMTPESAARMVGRLDARRELQHSAADLPTATGPSGLADGADSGRSTPDVVLPSTALIADPGAFQPMDNSGYRDDEAAAPGTVANPNYVPKPKPVVPANPAPAPIPPSTPAPAPVPGKDSPSAEVPAEQRLPFEGPHDRAAVESLKPGERVVLPSGVVATAGFDGTTSFATEDPATGHITTKTFNKSWAWVATAESDLTVGAGGLARDTTITGPYGVSQVHSWNDGKGNAATWTANPDGSYSVQYANGLIIKEPAPGSSTRPEVVQLSADGLSGVFTTVDPQGNPVVGFFELSRLGTPLTSIIDPDDPEGKRIKTRILSVPGPAGVSSIVEDATGVTVIDPDGTRTPVNSRFIAPPRRAHANEMFDAAQGRWVPAPPATPAGLAPDRSGPAWVYATGPAVLINRHDGTEVRVPQGGSDGADRPWTDVRILDNQGRELARYSEWANGNKTYRLGLNHTVTVGPDNKVIDPKHLDQSPLWDMHDYNRDDGSVTFNPINAQPLDLPRIALPPGVSGKGLYAYGDRLIIQTNDGKFHWVDPTPAPSSTVLPAERSIHRPWDYRDAAGRPTPAFQDQDGNHHFNVNGHEVVFTPDQQKVVDPPNSLRPSGTGGLYVDDRGPGGFNIGVKRLEVPPGVPAIGLWELDDGRLVIQDRFGGNHYVSPLPALPPQSLGAILSGLVLSIGPVTRGGGSKPKFDTLPRPTEVNIDGWFGPTKTTVTPPHLAQQADTRLPVGGTAPPKPVTPVRPTLTNNVTAHIEESGPQRPPVVAARQSPLNRVEPSDPTPETAGGGGGGGGGGGRGGGIRGDDEWDGDRTASPVGGGDRTRTAAGESGNAPQRFTDWRGVWIEEVAPRGDYQPNAAELAIGRRGLIVDEVPNIGDTTGARYVRLADGREGIIKPRSGEVLVIDGELIREGIPGGLADREVASWRMSALLKFGRVPPTSLVMTPDGEASFQLWVDGPRWKPHTQYPRAQQEEMAVLDYVIGNTDRKSGNWKTDTNGNVIAFDHGLAFPESPDPRAGIRSDFVFYNRNKRLGAEVLARVDAVDVNEMRAMLRDSGLSEVAIDGAVHRLLEIRSRRRITGENWSGTIFQSRLNTERMGQSTLGAALSMSTLPRREEEREDE